LLRHLPNVPLPEGAIPPGGQDTLLVDFTVPSVPGQYEIFVDVVESGVCWFSERSSPPLICSLEVRASPADTWNVGALVDVLYRVLLHRAPDPDGRAYWEAILRAGHPLEAVMRFLLDGAFHGERALLPAHTRDLRRALLREVRSSGSAAGPSTDGRPLAAASSPALWARFGSSSA
jgi:hypothetical protein